MNRITSVLALVFVGCACAASFDGPDAQAERFESDVDAGWHLEAQGRTCTALAVLRGSPSRAWDQQATTVLAVAHLVQIEAAPDACMVLPLLFAGELPRHPGPHELMEWQQALAVTDAVLSGEYTVPPVHCTEATHFSRLEAPTRQGASPAPSPSYCRVGSLSFYSRETP